MLHDFFTPTVIVMGLNCEIIKTKNSFSNLVATMSFPFTIMPYRKINNIICPIS